MSRQEFCRALVLGGLMLAISACGVRYREMYVSRIDLPEHAKKGERVNVTLINTTTPAGEASVAVNVDEAAKVVTFIVTEAESVFFFAGSPHPQMVVDRPLPATFTPRSSGTYQLRTRGGAATATLQVEE